jgi:pilus assembly protein CpaF
MNTGHDGSLTTIHANSPRDALMRLETMVAMANFEIPSDFLRHYISSAIDVVIHLARLTDGSRKLISLQEITGMEGNTITTQEIFSFRQKGIGPDGKVMGRFAYGGVRPKFVDRFRMAGFELSPAMFDPSNVTEV